MTTVRERLWANYIDAGKLALEAGRFPLAQSMLAAACAEAETFGKNSWRLAASQSQLASLYHRQGEFAKAKSLYVRALPVLESTQDQCEAALWQSLDSLADIYFQQGNYKRARPLLKRVIARLESTLGPAHPLTQRRLMRLGAVYTNLMKEGQAMDCLERARQTPSI